MTTEIVRNVPNPENKDLLEFRLPIGGIRETFELFPETYAVASTGQYSNFPPEIGMGIGNVATLLFRGFGPAPNSSKQIESTLRGLAELQNGWLDGEGISPSASAVLSAALLMVRDETLPRPRAYPSAEGGISLEWPVTDALAMEVEVHPEGAFTAGLSRLDSELFEEESFAPGQLDDLVRWLDARRGSSH